jgi:hypothetical protein
VRIAEYSDNVEQLQHVIFGIRAAQRTPADNSLIIHMFPQEEGHSSLPTLRNVLELS